MASTSRGSAGLLSFFIFNSQYGQKEGEEEKKVMFYFPQDAEIDTKVKNIGLAEAIVQFSSTFSDLPCQSVHTQKTRQLFLEPEKDFWMTMIVSLPCKERMKDGQIYTEYREEDVQDSVFESVLNLAYKMFKLFNGTFYHLLQMADGDVHVLKKRMESFYCEYLPILKLSQCDILDVFNGIHFLPLDKNTYLRIQCFINQLEATFPMVKYTAFLYNDKLVWSGLEQEDMRTLYQYLITSLFPSFLIQEHQGGNQGKLQGQGPSQFCKFMLGPADLADEKPVVKLPRVFVGAETDSEECYLLVYRALSSTICMLISEAGLKVQVRSKRIHFIYGLPELFAKVFKLDCLSVESLLCCTVSHVVDGSWREMKQALTVALCRMLNNMLAPQMTKLASDIKEQHYQRVAPPSAADPMFKYIYFNHMNLAQQTTVHIDLQKRAGVNIPQEIMRLLSDINADLTRSHHDGETVVKTTSDFWVVGKKSDSREFYVIINQKNANLIDINEEVQRLCTSHLNSVFFLD